MDDCIFCKIVRGELPSKKIYEDEDTYVFLDIAKDVDGHTLVIPKKHYATFLESDGDTLHAVMDTVQRVSAHYVKQCGYEGVNLYNCTDSCAGQTVFHYHIHIVPRKSGDGLTGFPKFGGATHSLEEMQRTLAL